MADISKINVNNTEYNIKDATARSQNIIEGQASGAIATFNDGGDNIPVKSLVTEIVATQSGTGTPSPSNIRSISGFDKVDVYRTNKNFFITEDGTVSGSAITFTMNADGTISASGTISSGNNNKNVGHVVLPAGDYIFSGLPSTLIGATRKCSLALAKYAYSGSANLIGVLNANDGVDGFAFTLTETTDCYLKIYVYAGAGTLPSNTVFKPMIESGSIVTEFVSHKGSIETIILPETIYGGSLECVSGSGYSDGVLIDLANYTGRVRALGENENKYFRFEELADSPDLTKRTLLLCDKFPTVEISVSNTNIGVDIIEPSTLGYTVIAFRPPNVSSYTTQTVLDYIRNTLNGLQVCYRKTPTTSLSVTGANITTLSGLNNIYSNTGDVEVEYFNDKADQIAELIKVLM